MYEYGTLEDSNRRLQTNQKLPKKSELQTNFQKLFDEILATIALLLSVCLGLMMEIWASRH